MKCWQDKKLESEIGVFVKQYKRKAHAGWDPNVRSYDRELEKKIKSMPPEELDRLMNGEGEEENIRLYVKEPLKNPCRMA